MPRKRKLSKVDHEAKVRIVEVLAHLGRHRKKDCWMGNKCMGCTLVKQLSILGFLPGEILEIEHVNIGGSPILIKVRGASYAICDIVASHIIIEEIIDAKEEKE